jgi:hypothetical protein
MVSGGPILQPLREVDDFRATTEMLSRSVRSTFEAEDENVRAHDALENHVADCLADMEQPIAIVELRRLFDEETRLKGTQRHSKQLPRSIRQPRIGAQSGSAGKSLTQFIFAGFPKVNPLMRDVSPCSSRTASGAAVSPLATHPNPRAEE